MIELLKTSGRLLAFFMATTPVYAQTLPRLLFNTL